MTTRLAPPDDAAIGTRPDTQEAETVAWVREAAARGVAEAQAVYGQMLLDGRGVARDPLRALHWFERAALGGHALAMNMVGRCHEQGWGVVRSAAMAAPWFTASAERGCDWGMYNLATLLTLGEGLPQDRARALHWFRQAAAAGHVKSLNLIGGFYEDGWEVPRDRGQARDFYRRAAEGGDFRGQFNYGRLLAEDGELHAAIGWLRQVPATATPAFLQKMVAFLLASPLPALRTLGDEMRARLAHAGPAIADDPHRASQ